MGISSAETVIHCINVGFEVSILSSPITRKDRGGLHRQRGPGPGKNVEDALFVAKKEAGIETRPKIPVRTKIRGSVTSKSEAAQPTIFFLREDTAART
jgi:hypothetical protein